MSVIWSFRAVDTWFFRDGTPFNPGETPLAPASQFPPTIETLQGAIRTQLARLGGWREGDEWPAHLGTPHSLGDLTLKGPFLRLHGEYLFPLPFSLLRRKDGSYVQLAPSKDTFHTDLGHVHLPALPVGPDVRGNNRGAKNVDEAWLTAQGLAKVLSADVPDAAEVKHGTELWSTETRVGIQLDPESRTVMTGMLNSAVHVRPNADLTVDVEVSGTGLAKMPPPTLTRLGGGSRQAKTVVAKGRLPIPPMPSLHAEDGLLHYTATLLTPGFFAEQTKHVLRRGIPAMPGKLVAAAIGKLTQQGGWDLQAHRPRPSMPIVPAGSTWFYTAPKAAKSQIQQLHGQHVSQRSAYGYGQIAIGTWRDFA